ncbi:MAG TPA: hypothetical protein VFH88_15320 [Candidatus Krumholzibacteria bacterium]|nr:hypothetical protein [Candidatus Krumholzibacteria bacterium]
MKRTVAFLAAVCVSTGISYATLAGAQTAPPPAEASGDTLKTTGETKAAPAEPAAPAATDSISAGARARRVHMRNQNPRSFVISLGLGSGVEYRPLYFKDNFKPAFGGVLGVGVRQYGFTAGVRAGFNMYFANGVVPNDLNIFTVFADLSYSPFHSTATPYLVVCGGYYRQWIVNLNYTENVLGYGGGAGVEIKIDKVRRLFIDGRFIQGRTREFEPTQANTETFPIRFGITWELK